MATALHDRGGPGNAHVQQRQPAGRDRRTADAARPASRWKPHRGTAPSQIKRPWRARANIIHAFARLQACGQRPTPHTYSPDTTGYCDAHSDFPCSHPFAPPPRNRLRARGVRGARGRQAVTNAPASRRPAPDLTLPALKPWPRRRAPGRSHSHAVSFHPNRTGVPVVKKTKTCYLTELDVARLEKHAAAPGADAKLQDMLDDVLERAVIVDSREIPASVVTMNSQA